MLPCRIFLAGWVSVSIALLSGCSLFNSEKNVVTMSPLPKVENQFTPTTVWNTAVGSGIGVHYSHLRPASWGNKVYAADRKGLVKAIDADNGKTMWQTDLSEKGGLFSSNKSMLLSGGITVSDSHAYIGSEKAVVYALNTEDGSVVWQANVAGEVLSRPVVSDGMVLIHTSNGMLQALNASDGVIKWTLNLDVPTLSLRGESTPSIAFGAAIVGSHNGRVSAVLMQQGQLIWQQRISQVNGSTEIDRLNDINTTPIIVEDVVYVLAYNGNLAALDLRSGQLLWKRELGSVHDFIVDAGRIYLVDKDDRIVALSTKGDMNLWHQSDLLHRNLTAPVMYNGYLVIGDAEGYLHWVNADDGSFMVQQDVDRSGFLSGPIVANDKLMIQAKNGKVYAFTH